MPPPILLLHGLDDTARIFRRMREFLEAQGRTVHAIDLLPSNGALGLDGLAEQVDAYIRANFDTPIDLVGFSMGGIVGRYYLQRLGGLSRVRRFVTLGSPHNGTWTGWLRWNRGASQMRRNSPFLVDLNRDAEVLRQVHFTTIWTPLDLMILPAHSSVLAPGKSIRVGVPMHWMLVKDERVFRMLDDLLT